MVLRIARHELIDVVRDGRFRVAAAIVAGLLLVATLAGWSHQRAVSAQHAAAAGVSRQTWLAQAAKDPHSAAHYGAYVFKPRGPLTLVDSGVDAYTGVAAWLEAHKQNEFQFRPAQDRASVSRLGHLTAAVTLQALVPILIILLAFTKYASEREDGTLRQLVATGVGPRQLAAGKTLGVVVALTLVLGPAAALGGLALLWSSGTTAAAHSLARLAALMGVYGAYFAVVIGVSLAVSAWVRRASHALAILLALWAFNAVVAPRVATAVARSRHPAPAAVEFQQRVHQDMYDGVTVHEYNLRRAPGLRARLLAAHAVARVEDLPVNFRGVDYLEREAHSDAVWDAHYGTLWAAFERQVAVHQAAGVAAPLLAVRAASMALSGADLHHHQHFVWAAETYRRRLVLAMNTDLAQGGTSARRGAYTADPALWATIDPFEYSPPTIGWALDHVRLSVVTLVAWVAAASVAVLVVVRRQGVE
jgi:ABC-2 type transport system permease protein